MSEQNVPLRRPLGFCPATGTPMPSADAPKSDLLQIMMRCPSDRLSPVRLAEGWGYLPARLFPA
jgi:hypothetical protein